jgi:hypothetical protein
MVERPEIPCCLQEGYCISSGFGVSEPIRETVSDEPRKRKTPRPIQKNLWIYAQRMKQKLFGTNLHDATEKDEGYGDS